MNRHIHSIIRPLALVALLTLLTTGSSCRKVPIHGWLEGMWQTTLIEFTDGTTIESPGFYYCFELHTAQVLYNGRIFTAQMQYDDDTHVLTLQFPYATAEELRPTGIDGPECSFKLLTHTGQRIVMTSSIATITMRKF